MAKLFKRMAAKKELLCVYIKQFQLYCPMPKACKDSFVKVDMMCKRGKSEKWLNSLSSLN